MASGVEAGSGWDRTTSAIEGTRASGRRHGRREVAATGWIVRWHALEERFASASEALDRWERLDALGREPELVEVAAETAAPVACGTVGEESPGTAGEADAP
jgi:hypothetical protein